MPKKPMTEQERKRAYDRGDISATEYSKLVYEESPYKDRERDSQMRNDFNAALSTAGAGRGGQGGPTAKQADQNRGTMSAAEKAARDEAAETKMQERTNKAAEEASKNMKKGGSVFRASANGIAQRGKTRGKMC